jgi:hypothetical protein
MIPQKSALQLDRMPRVHRHCTPWHAHKEGQGSRAVGDKLTSIVHKMDPLIAMSICIAKKKNQNQATT